MLHVNLATRQNPPGTSDTDAVTSTCVPTIPRPFPNTLIVNSMSPIINVRIFPVSVPCIGSPKREADDMVY